MRSHSKAPAMKGRAEQSCHNLQGRISVGTVPWGGCSVITLSDFRQKLHKTNPGLSLRFVPLVAFIETERTWAETINTAGHQGLFLPWQEHHSKIFPCPQDIHLPSSQGHFPPGSLKAESKGQDMLSEGSSHRGCSSSFHTHPYKGNHRAGSLPSSAKPHHWSNRGGKKSLHKTNPTGFPHSNPLPRVRYLHCFSHLLFWGA